ncbi:MAG TPA: VOC family protein, partial [Caulobacter sp.]|nr:VOC family protein [Caulobacter sp.]
MAKVNYVTVGSNDLEKARAFYDDLLGSIGFKPLFDHPSGGRLYRGDGCMFGVLGPYDGNPACVGNGMMGGFAFDTVEEG